MASPNRSINPNNSETKTTVAGLGSLFQTAIDLRRTLARRANVLAMAGTSGDQFRIILKFAIDHRIITARDLVDTLTIDKSRVTVWIKPKEEGGSTPNVPTQRSVLTRIAAVGNRQADYMEKQRATENFSDPKFEPSHDVLQSTFESVAVVAKWRKAMVEQGIQVLKLGLSPAEEEARAYEWARNNDHSFGI